MKSVSQFAKMSSIPLPEFATVLSGIILILGGLSILFWYGIVYGVILLLIFLIPATLFVHKFWMLPDHQLRNLQFLLFMRNIALIGFLLVILKIK
jgi:uncharacterized membrane protein YphA (DoxX/SURF4 family)